MKTNTKPINLVGLCIATPTEEELKQACEIAATNGWGVAGVDKHFSDYGENTCLYFSEKTHTFCQYGSRQWFVSNDCIVLTMSDLLFTAGIRENSPSKPSEVISDGGSTNGYYEITITNKDGETFTCQMGDIIRATVANDFDLGNIMKACRRISEAVQGRGKSGTNISYDCNKIKYFADEVAHFQGRGKFTYEEKDTKERILSDTQIN
jgi:hypothetical protein